MEQKVAYRGEAQLLRWSDSSTGGPTITLALPDSECLEHFRSATLKKGGKAGQLYAVMIVELDPDAVPEEAPAPAPVEPSKSYGAYYQPLYRSGWFFNPRVPPALGTDEDYRAWIQRQPSAISGQFSEYVDGEGRCVAAHVRRVASGAGTGHKNLFSCIPLTDAEHQLQHQRGEGAFGGPAVFDKLRGKYLTDWIKLQLYAHFFVTSLAEVPPETFVAGMRELGLLDTLPPMMRTTM